MNAIKHKAPNSVTNESTLDHPDGGNFSLLLFDEELSNPLVSVGNYYLSGKDISTFFTAVISSRDLQHDRLCLHQSFVVGTFVEMFERVTDRCTNFLLSIDAPNTLVELLHDRSSNLKSTIMTLQDMMYQNLSVIMKAVSEWSVLLDYCEQIPTRLSKKRMPQDEEPIRPLWIIGAGKFGSTESPSILSVPNQSWRPELLFLGEKWMVDFPRDRPNLSYFFCMAPLLSDEVAIEDSAAILSWKDEGFLAHMHRAVDIEAGMVVYHEFPVSSLGDEEGCCLNWVSQAYSKTFLGASTRVALGKSEKLKWMMNGTKWDNNMLAIMDIKNDCIPEDHMNLFYDRMIKLMVEVEIWI